MDINNHFQWLVNFYKQRGWYSLSPFVRMNFLNEETGELGRAIRTVEIGRDHPGEVAEDKSVAMDNLKEELADVLDQVLIVADKYDVTPEELFEQSESKLKGRFK